MYNYAPEVRSKSIHLMTFGKDSLLSYALAEELKLDPVAVYVEEPDTKYMDPTINKINRTYENKHKDVLIKKFYEEFKKPVYKIKHQLSLTRESKYFGVDTAELPWGSQLTEYAFLSIPFNHYFKARYLVYGNEASCSNKYLNKEGILTNAAFDQSGEWTVEISKLMKLLTKSMSAISLIEPIHELAIIKILHHRYPQYAKYQMSCMASNNNARYSRWCHNCSKCARIYAFLVANDIDPAQVNFKENMFKKSKINLFSLFGASRNALPYDMAGTGRNELLLAFYLSYKNGAKGYLIDLFKKKMLKEAENKKDTLMKEFYGVHESKTIPARYIKPLHHIFNEELNILNKKD